MTTEHTAEFALVHVPVLERKATAIYVARRDAATLFVAGPGFTDDDPSCFRPVPLGGAFALDESLSELAALPVGRCAFRNDPADPWTQGAIPLGTTFLVRYQARPDESHPGREELAGAFVNCWIVADSLESALRRTADEIAGSGWVIGERTSAEIADPAEHADDSAFRQAQIDGLVLVFHTFGKEELGLGREAPGVRSADDVELRLRVQEIDRTSDAESEPGVIGTVREDGFPVVFKFVDRMPPEETRARFGWLTVVAWKYDGHGRNGMPASDTNSRMLDLEHAIDYLEQDGHCLHAYSRTGNGLKELVYYISDRERFLEAFNDALEVYPAFPIEITFYQDEPWADFQAVLDRFARTG